MLGKKGVAACVALVLCTGCTDGGWTQSMREAWGTMMEVFRVALCIAGAAAIIPAALLIPRRGLANVIVGVFGCLFAFVIFLSYFDFFNPNVRYHKYYHRHEFFHSFLPAKYTKELGYDRLYLCSVAAQRELPGVEPVTIIRDMTDGVLKPVAQVIPIGDERRCKASFSAERWEAFKTDIQAIEAESRGSYFEGMHKDAGFNDSPVWTLLAAFPARLFSANQISFSLLSSFDVVLQLGMFVLVAWAFGWRILLLSTIFWACNAASTFYWSGGAYLAQLWLFWLVAAACLAKKRLPLPAGASLAVAGLLQPYAAILFVGPLILIAVRLVRRRGIGKGIARFFAGAAVAFFLLVPVSAVFAGPASYSNFVARTLRYSERPFTNQVGLGFLLSHEKETRMQVLRDDKLVDPFLPWREKRYERMQAQRPLIAAAALVIALWTAWALQRNRSLWLSVALGFPLFMTVFSPTCFHLSFAVLLPLVAFARPGLGALLLLAIGASQLVLEHVYWIDDRYALLTMPLYFACLAALCACSWSWTLRALKGSVGGRASRREAPAR
jgi:hypothetical protein